MEHWLVDLEKIVEFFFNKIDKFAIPSIYKFLSICLLLPYRASKTFNLALKAKNLFIISLFLMETLNESVKHNQSRPRIFQ